MDNFKKDFYGFLHNLFYFVYSNQNEDKCKNERVKIYFLSGYLSNTSINHLIRWIEINEVKR